MRRSALAAFLILLLPCFSFAGHIDLNLSLEATVPGLSHPIEQVKFNDIDGDNVPEILACDGFRLVLYSVSGDSTIMSVDIDPGHLNYLILFDNINMDSLPDVVLATYKCGGTCEFGYHDGLDSCRVILYDPANGYAQTGVRTYSWYQLSAFTTPQGIQGLQAVDLNRDGWNELMISIDRLKSIYWETTDGVTEAYYNFPFGLTYERSAVTTGFHPICDTPEGSTYLSNELNQFYTETGPDTYSYEIYCSMRDATGTYLKRLRSPDDLSCLYWEQGDFVSKMEYATCGNLIVGWGGNDVLFTYHSSMACTYVVNPDSVLNTNGSESGQQLYRMIGTDSLRLVWENQEQYHDYVYHPLFPGYYLAFGDTTLYQFKGIDGSRHQSIGNLPEGERWWDYPYNDDVPRLIVVADQTVKIYTLDISTDAPEDNSETLSLPGSFVLSSPYPNPFNAEVAIPIQVLKPGHLSVAVYNTLGQRVRTLLDRPTQSGEIMLSWDATAFASGVYVIDVRLGDQRDSRTIQLVK